MYNYVYVCVQMIHPFRIAKLLPNRPGPSSKVCLGPSIPNFTQKNHWGM